MNNATATMPRNVSLDFDYPSENTLPRVDVGIEGHMSDAVMQRQEVRRGCVALMRAQIALWRALYRETEQDMKAYEHLLFPGFQRDDVVRMHARASFHRASELIFRRVSKQRPGKRVARSVA